MALFQHGHALLIGVSDYQDEGLKLPAPVTAADARGVADALRDPNVGAYPEAQVRLLQGAETARDAVLAAAGQLAARVKEADTAFVFFCGHGVLDKEGVYTFTTRDTKLTPDKRAVKGTGVSAGQLLELLRAVRATKLLFVLNTCFSGHLGPTLAPADALGAPPSATLGAEILDTGEGRVVITAGRPSQLSYYDTDQPHTYFGQALIDGLSGKGVSGSGGYVGLFELYQHVYARVKQVSRGAQEPVLNIVRGVGPFPVALHGGGKAATLDAFSAIRQTPPPGTAVEALERAAVRAIGRIRAGGDVKIDSGDRLIDMGQGNTFQGGVSFGDVARGDITKVTVTLTSAAAAAANDDRDVLRLIDQLQADVSRLTDVPPGRRQDAGDDLRKAREAGKEGDRPRMREKLESAQKYLMPLAESSPAALKVAEAIGILLQRAMGLRS